MTLFLLVSTLLLLTLPFLPAVREWAVKSDAAPLTVIQDHHGQLDFFATQFRNFLTRDLGRSLVAWVAANRDSADATLVTKPGTDQNNNPVVSVGGQYAGDISAAINAALSQVPGNAEPRVLSVVACARARLQANASTLADVYVAGDATLGANSQVRAITTDGHLVLEKGATVLRWADAFTMALHAESYLPGRITAKRGIVMAAGTQFQRLQAPVIKIVSNIAHDSLANAIESSSRSEQTEPAVRLVSTEKTSIKSPTPSSAATVAKRWYSKDDIEIKAGQIYYGDIVTKGKLTIRQNAVVHGSIKAHKNIMLESQTQVLGAVVSDAVITVGPGVKLTGPVIADDTLNVLGGGTVIGSSRFLTTLIARRINLHADILFHGFISAYETGQVVLDNETTSVQPGNASSATPIVAPISTSSLTRSAVVNR